MQHDDAVLQAALAGNLDRTSGQLVCTYQHRLYAFIVRQTGGVEEAEDIVQEAFIQAYFALARYTPEQVRHLALRPWLYKITLNIFYGRLRRRHLQAVSLDLSEEGPHLSIEDERAYQPEELFESGERRRELSALVGQLPLHYRTVVNLYYFEGLSYQEIADLLNIPMGSVKSHLYRAIRRLRQAMTIQRQEGR